MSKYVPCAASGLMSANLPSVFFDNILHSSCHKSWPNILCLCSSHIPKTSVILLVFYSRNGVPFITGLVDSSPNVYCCGQKVQYWSHHSIWLCARRIVACLCAVWRICVVMAFFWRLDHSTHLSSSASLLYILKQPHYVFSNSPVFQVVCGFFFASLKNFPGSCVWHHYAGHEPHSVSETESHVLFCWQSVGMCIM